MPPSNEGPAQHTGTVIIPNLIKFHVKLPSSPSAKEKGKKLNYWDKKSGIQNIKNKYYTYRKNICKTFSNFG